MSNLKVAVRIRPMSERELASQSVSSVFVDNGVVSVTNVKVPTHHAGDSRERVRKFTFDYCFGEDSTQDEIFSMVEEEVANALSSRYHACVLAYGQSSTGKTYTMMGLQNEPGLTPRLCENIFKYFQSSVTEDEMKNMYTSVSYLEIYNERVQDLLTSGNNARSLKVREHPKRGPYVQGLSEHRVQNSAELLTWLSTGNGNRRVAATLNNRRSSRSHSVFTVSSGQGTVSSCCRLHLVDLAGSERAHSAAPEHSTPRLKEGANINRSLVALGNVICALSEQSGKTRNSRKRFVPYRDSVLTWLLKETLGGNSKSVMVATISPSSVCYSETVNTLRFGQRAKQIVNRPVVNEDAKEKLIRELRTEIARLRELLHLQNGNTTALEVNVDNSRCTEMTDSSSDQKAESNKEDLTDSQTDLEDAAGADTLNRVALNESVPELENTSENKPVQEHFETVQEETPIAVRQTDETARPCEQQAIDVLTSQSHIQTDSLIPVIDVTSSVKPRQLQPTRLNRTYSVDFPRSVIGKLRKDFGSHETLPSTTSSKPSMLTGKQSRENLTNKAGKVEKPVETSSRSGSISESSGKSTPKQNATRKTHRREVVAAVTQRLYSQQARKLGDDKSSTTDLSILPRQTLCSSARMRLQELTQRALRASKRKTHSETQTEHVSTLRLKEKATDVQDIEVALLEVKHATVEAIVDVHSVGVSCHVENYNQTLKLTRSCSSQTDEQPKTQSVSFTKYLQNPPLAIHSYSQPIYTSSVNINVSHNYPFPRDEVSDDSLEDSYRHNVHYSTPDLISNHNSLEQNIIQKPTESGVADEKHATVDKSVDKFYTNEYFATDSTEYCFASTSLVPSIDEKVNNVSVPVVRAAEIRQIDECSETCLPFRPCEIKLVKPVQTFETFKAVTPKCYLTKGNSKKLKSIIKPKNNLSAALADCSTEESDTDSSISFNKRVRFSPHIRRTDMFGVLQSFMDEASSLMCKLNAVAKHVEHAEDQRNRHTCQRPQERDRKECYVQTYLSLHDAASQTSPPARQESSSPVDLLSDSEISESKWETIVKTSCDKLDQCIRLAEHKSREDVRRKFHTNTFDSECLHKFPQPFSSDTDWKYCPTEYSSLETTHSASDYGSLPRRDGQFRKSPYKNYSPKAYMKQLVALRKQIVETSRNDLMEELRPTLPNH
ncbi:Kinesin-like protein at 98A [Carabus blaptoides fortunei]